MAEMRLEKRVLIAKRNAFKEIMALVDPYFEAKEKVKEIASESGLDGTWLWQWATEQFEMDEELLENVDEGGVPEEDENDEDEEAEETEQAEEE